MGDSQKLLLYGAAAIGVVGLIALWRAGQSPAVGNGQGLSVNFGGSPSSPPTYTPATFSIAAPPAGANFVNPGSKVIFDFGLEHMPRSVGTGAGVGLGGGSPDGSCGQGPCNCPDSGTEAFGSQDALAAALGPLTQYLANNFLPAPAAGFGGSQSPFTGLPYSTDPIKQTFEVWKDQKAMISDSWAAIFPPGGI